LAVFRAAESVGKIPESLILVGLYDAIRIFFERKWRASRAENQSARTGRDYPLPPPPPSPCLGISAKKSGGYKIRKPILKKSTIFAKIVL
jgi:hypothetical protein